jgi:hypothetical protein
MTGAILLPMLLLWGTHPPWGEASVWFILLVLAGLGATYSLALILSAERIRARSRAVRVTLVILGFLSALVLVSHLRDAKRASDFLARADSAYGVITNVGRPSSRLRATFHFRDSTYVVLSDPVDSLAGFTIGDSVWLYFPPSAPDSAHFGHPSADGARTRNLLLWVWLVAGPIVCGYGPPIWRVIRGVSRPPPILTS